EQIIALFDKREELAKQAEEWLNAAALAKQRLPRWQALQELLQHADGMPVAEEVKPQVAAIVEQRSLLSGTDPAPPLCKSLTAALRTALTTVSNECTAVFDAQNKALTGSEVWQKLDTDKRAAILAACGLTSLPKVKVAAEDELLASLRRDSIADWKTLVDALPQRFNNALLAAAQALEPKAVRVMLPSATIRNTAEMEAWLGQARGEISAKLKQGPVVI
ncbi:MAG: BREX system P-loop protein BrxC, partial [Planctomycetota bacterium]